MAVTVVASVEGGPLDVPAKDVLQRPDVGGGADAALALVVGPVLPA
jgi:hypothetical protein